MIKHVFQLTLFAILMASCASTSKYSDIPSFQRLREVMYEDFWHEERDDGYAVMAANMRASQMGKSLLTTSTTIGSSVASPYTAGTRILSGVAVRKDSTAFIYPREAILYKYHQVGVEAEVDMPDAESVVLWLRTFPTKASYHGPYDVRIETADIKQFPFKSFKPVKYGKNVWTFKGEMKVNPRFEAVPDGKELYLKYKIKFNPDNRFKRKMSYQLKTRKAGR